MPILLSTGASNITEIKEAVKFIKKYNKKICIMHCTLCYPTQPRDANLSALIEINKNFKNYTLGLSDHSLGTNISSASVLYGVRVIEKHFTYNKKLLKSADHPISIDKNELKLLRKNVDELIQAIGFFKKEVLECENLTRRLARRSLVSLKYVKKNELLSFDNVGAKRPGTGISPNKFKSVIGKRARFNIKEDALIKLKDIY